MRLPTLEQFGTCPECHSCDGYRNIGKGHWFYCERHKLDWYVGSNLFSSWQDETEADWRASHEKLADSRTVDPSNWGWADVPRDELLRWFREWRRFIAWNLYGRAFSRLRNKYRPRRTIDPELPF